MAGVGVDMLGGAVFPFFLRWLRRRCLPIGPVLLSFVALLSSFVFLESCGTVCAGAGVSTLRAGIFTFGWVVQPPSESGM